MRRTIAVLAVACAVGGLAVAGIALAHTSSHTTKKGAALQVRKGKLGRFVVDSRGMTLYLFEKDKGRTSACYGSCPKVWAPYLTSAKPRAKSGLSAARVGTTKRKDGTTQVTYGGHPLYHYDDDKKPGQTEGEGSKEFGAKWYVVGTNGKKIDND
jgi:predicted lipoprotein with Yx(FWY)xxD motif